MEECQARKAADANQAVYDSGWTEIFFKGAPHLKHASLRALWTRQLSLALERAAEHAATPRVLDLGAGEGSVTQEILQQGASVTAVDVSESQLAELCRKCRPFADRLQTHRGELSDALTQLEGPYDLVVASACLHHLPDYLGVIRQAMERLTPNGQFLSFHDPLRYDRLGWFTRGFSELSYLSWRVLQGDLWGGLQRRHRRHCGLNDNAPLDQAEYHVVRGGVDADAIVALLASAGFECQIIRYFSSQSRLFQPVGQALGVKNTFGIVARRARAASAGHAARQ